AAATAIARRCSANWRTHPAGSPRPAWRLKYATASSRGGRRQGTPMVVCALVGVLLVATSLILFGDGRSPDGVPGLAGIGLAISGPLFAVIGFAFDNWIETMAAILMAVCAAWIVVALHRTEREAADHRRRKASVPAAGVH